MGTQPEQYDIAKALLPVIFIIHANIQDFMTITTMFHQ